MSELNALEKAIENQWGIHKAMLAGAKGTDRVYYSAAVDALEEAMAEFDPTWVATLRSKAAN